jgi:hypothetical protein
MKVRVFRVLLPEIPEQNSGSGYSGFGFRFFCPALGEAMVHIPIE